jgi:alanyl-tRNA synthetase
VEYIPYGPTTAEARLVAITQRGVPVESLSVGDRVEVVLDRTAFYVESGGQVSDTGVLTGDGWEIEVDDMRQPVGGLIVHIGEVTTGVPQVGDAVSASVNAARRADIIRNHTGTHLLHAALRHHLGTHVQQRGSLVAPDRLRFDFAHDARVDDEQLKTNETEVNDIILANYPVHWEYKPLKKAREEGAMALFGEKYGETVRTVIIEQDSSRYSYELCGGVHVPATADIGLFVLVSEGSVSAGVRRIEAFTGHRAVEYVQHQRETLEHIAGHLSTTPDAASHKVAALQDELQSQRREIDRLRRELARGSFTSHMQQIEQINGMKALILQLADTPMETLREMSDWFRGSVDSGVFVAGTDNEGKPQLLVMVTDDLVKKGLNAGDIVKQAAAVVGGGGGRPNMAQAGGKDSARLSEALARAREIITQRSSG